MASIPKIEIEIEKTSRKLIEDFISTSSNPQTSVFNINISFADLINPFFDILKAKDCLGASAEEISATFDIGLDSAKQIVWLTKLAT